MADNGERYNWSETPEYICPARFHCIKFIYLLRRSLYKLFALYTRYNYTMNQNVHGQRHWALTCRVMDTLDDTCRVTDTLDDTCRVTDTLDDTCRVTDTLDDTSYNIEQIINKTRY